MLVDYVVAYRLHPSGVIPPVPGASISNTGFEENAHGEGWR